MPRARRTNSDLTVEATVHTDAKRTNIPTSELEGFLRPEDRAPTKVLYPRDPSLDPQLVWQGKDEQDRDALEVPAVPIYIQEKIAAKALVEDLRRQSSGGEQPGLFADFNGIEFDDLVDFYRHEQNWSNRMILGDSLLVMTSLAEKENLKGHVQCLYLDPPYGIKFGSNWQVSTRKRDVRDGKVADATRQPEQIKAFRDTWEKGIHSYLTYLRDRLLVGRELLAETGSLFVQIGDVNAHLVRALLDEVFGSRQFLAEIHYMTTSGRAADYVDNVTDRVLWYAKDKESVKHRSLWRRRSDKTIAEQYTLVESEGGSIRRLSREEIEGAEPLPPGARRFMPDNMTSSGESEEGSQPFEYEGTSYELPPNTHWKTHRDGLTRLAAADRLMPIGQRLRYKRFDDDFPWAPYTNVWDDTVISGYSADKLYVVQTSPKVIERCLLMATDPGDLVLDPTCGSGTTAFVAEQWGRRWITIDTSRVALALARTRLMSARYPYYSLADPNNAEIRRGFTYKQVPHITLRSIANNPDIAPGMASADLERTIARHGDSETLYDQPEITPRIVRVAGPFTVESLSPHLIEPTIGGDDQVASEGVEDVNRFERLVLDHLRSAGVQNTVRKERLTFESLTPWAGTRVHAVGEYQENGQTKHAAVTVGPEYGTVTSDLVREAAKEAVRHFDLLVVCGFAFDGYVSEESKQLGGLTILRATMNPDISLGEDLLKKTGAGNLFMVFGEPDISITHEEQELKVEIRGLDVYDPTTGELRSHTTKEIACWFIDTDYNGESFFVRHAYFLGAGDAFDDLRRALRAEISDEAWASVNSAVSRPFPSPSTGRIAIKVINHYGDEVLKVYAS